MAPLDVCCYVSGIFKNAPQAWRSFHRQPHFYIHPLQSTPCSPLSLLIVPARPISNPYRCSSDRPRTMKNQDRKESYARKTARRQAASDAEFDHARTVAQHAAAEGLAHRVFATEYAPGHFAVLELARDLSARLAMGTSSPAELLLGADWRTGTWCDAPTGTVTFNSETGTKPFQHSGIRFRLHGNGSRMRTAASRDGHAANHHCWSAVVDGVAWSPEPVHAAPVAGVFSCWKQSSEVVPDPGEGAGFSTMNKREEATIEIWPDGSALKTLEKEDQATGSQSSSVHAGLVQLEGEHLVLKWSDKGGRACGKSTEGLLSRAGDALLIDGDRWESTHP